jgi:endonuclease YncB( thermonuclease family)
MTADARFCPSCGRRRHGYFRFCNECGYDFDELAPRSETTIAETTQAAPVLAAVSASPPVLAAVSMERPVAPPSGKKRRLLSERTLVRLSILVLAGFVAISGVANLMRPSSGKGPGVASVALETPLVGEASPSEDVSEPTFKPQGETRVAYVTQIVDGDTIRVDIDGEEFPLRYIGMDTPEENANDAKIKEMADAATAANARLVEGEQVYLEKDVSDTDRYGRLLRDVWIVDDTGTMVLVNLELVREGFAQIATFPPDVRYVDELTAAQQEAQADKVGLWAPASSASGSGEPGLAAPGSSVTSPSGAPAASSTPAP